jgi:hypothetical protein
MGERLGEYQERRDAALKIAADNPLDQQWLRIEWQKQHDLLSRDLATKPRAQQSVGTGLF